MSGFISSCKYLTSKLQFSFHRNLLRINYTFSTSICIIKLNYRAVEYPQVNLKRFLKLGHGLCVYHVVHLQNATTVECFILINALLVLTAAVEWEHDGDCPLSLCNYILLYTPPGYFVKANWHNRLVCGTHVCVKAHRPKRPRRAITQLATLKLWRLDARRGIHRAALTLASWPRSSSIQ